MTKKRNDNEIVPHVREHFAYNDGILYWRTTRNGSVKIGDVAGTLHDKGYWRIGFMGKDYYRSNLVWIYHHGEFPIQEIDHRNRVRTDDRIENLMHVPTFLNAMNRKPRNNTLPEGVKKQQNSRGYQVRISIEGKRINLGTFDCPIEGGRTYQEVKADYLRKIGYIT